MLADCLEVFLLTDGLWSDSGLFGRGLDAVVEKALERRGAFVFDDVQGVGEFAIPNGRAGLERAFEELEHLPGAFDGFGRAFEFDPAFA